MSWNYLFGKKIISEYESEGNFPSIIHNHTWMTFPSALMIKEHFNSKLISSLHFLEKQYDGLKETPTEIDLEDILSIENLIMEKSDAIIVFGENHKNFVLKNYNANEKKIQIINHGIDLDQHQKYVSSPQVYIDKIRINFVGRLVPEKGVMELVQAINELKDNYPYIELNLIGDGYLKEKIVENENIVLHGFLLPQQILEMNKKANIFCFPSYTETFGYAVLEAMASGLPIITTKGERVERLLNPDEALFVNVNYCKKVSMDYGLFKNHIEQLILSSDMRQHFSQKSLVASKRYSKLNMINKTKALYESIDKN